MPGRAEPALQPVLGAERRLHRMQLARPPASPSAVVTCWPAACAASTVHDFTDSPFSSTVQAPHEVVSQPTLAARRPHTSRR